MADFDYRNGNHLGNSSCDIPAKPLHNRDIVSVHFNHFYCMGNCDNLTRHLSMLTYISTWMSVD